MSRFQRNGTCCSVFLAAVLGLFFMPAASARTQQELMRACAEEWNELKAANKTAGKVYQDFVKECLAKHKAAEQPAPGRAAATTAEPAAGAGKTNLNTATAAELDRLPQISAARAKAIIAARDRERFKSWEDFVARKVVPAGVEAAIKDLVGF